MGCWNPPNTNDMEQIEVRVKEQNQAINHEANHQATRHGASAKPTDSQLTNRMLNNMIEKYGKIDLTKPGAWGRFVHNVRQDERLEKDPHANVEKSVTVFKQSGEEGKGRIDILSKNEIFEVKSHDLDTMSDKQLAHFLIETVHQIERYQWSPDIEGKPGASVILENPPCDPGRRDIVQHFFERREINVIWGK